MSKGPDKRRNIISYATQAKLARDQALLDRVTACAATQNIHEPTNWAYDHQWCLSAEPGWDDAYAYALRSENEDPGADESVITDGMILSAVQAHSAATSAEKQ